MGIRSHMAARHSNLSRTNAIRKRQGRERLAIFAEALAEGATVKRAGEMAGVSKSACINMSAQLKRELGWQAQ